MRVQKKGKCKKQTQSKGVHHVYWEEKLFQITQVGNKTKQSHTLVTVLGQGPSFLGEAPLFGIESENVNEQDFVSSPSTPTREVYFTLLCKKS